MNPRILDMTAGNRAVWYDKNHPHALYVDIRPEVEPDIIHDFRDPLPGDEWEFDLVLFDPPHANCGKNGIMSKRYGHHTAAEIREFIAKGAHSAWTHSHPMTLMALKWNNHDIKLSEVFSLLAPYWVPLFGHLTKNGPRSQTYWVMLKRGKGGDE